MNKRVLVIVDPQNDFVDPFGTLHVKGAEEAIENLVKFIKEQGDTIDEIVVSLDSHFKYHISNKCFWKTPVMEGTVITRDNLSDFEPVDNSPENLTNIELALKNLGPVTIWPEHCLVGTWGHNIYEKLSEALHEWTTKKHKIFKTIQKGRRTWAEEYSVLSSEVMWDPMIEPELKNIDDVSEYLVSGVAGDYCVRNTVEDMMKYLPISSFTLLSNCIATIDPENSEYLGYIQRLKEDGVKFLSV